MFFDGIYRPRKDFFSYKRIDESSRIKWEDVDFDEGVIKIQKQNTKKKVADHVPMTPYLLCLLNQRQQNPIESWKKEYAGNPYVFWSMRKKMGHCKDPVKTLKNISINKRSLILNCGYGKGYSVFQVLNNLKYLNNDVVYVPQN